MKKKREVFIYNLLDWPLMEKHFSDRAKEGWLLKKIRFGVATYERTIPENYDFKVAIYPKVKPFESINQKQIEPYRLKQINKGWQFISAYQNIQVFCKKMNEEALPLERKFQLENIESHKKLETFSLALLIIINLFNIFRIYPPKLQSFTTNMGLFALIIIPLMTLFLTIYVIRNIRFIHKRSEWGDDIEKYNPSMKSLKMFRVFEGMMMFMVTSTLALAILGDIFHSSIFIVRSLLPVFIGLTLGLVLRRFFAGREMSSFAKGVIVLLVVGVTVSTSMSWVIQGLDDLESEQDQMIAWKEGTQIFSSDEKWLYEDFEQRASFLVPVYQRYRGYTDDTDVRVTVIEGMTESMTKHLYSLLIADHQKYGRFTIHYKVELAELTNVIYDEAHFVMTPSQWENPENGRQLVVRKGTKIVSIHLTQDWNDPLWTDTVENWMADLLLGSVSET